MLTDPSLPSGSDRILAALDWLDPDRRHDVVINLQGDIPFADPAMVRLCADVLEDHPDSDISTIIVARVRAGGPRNPDVVKAIVPFGAGEGRAGALFHPLDPLWRGAGVAPYRHLRLSPRGAGAIHRRPAFAAGTA